MQCNIHIILIICMMYTFDIGAASAGRKESEEEGGDVKEIRNMKHK